VLYEVSTEVRGAAICIDDFLLREDDLPARAGVRAENDVLLRQVADVPDRDQAFTSAGGAAPKHESEDGSSARALVASVTLLAVVAYEPLGCGRMLE
jgi:hypothetical protein